MRKVLDPTTGTVHLLDRRSKKAHGTFYLCACGISSGLLWENIAQSTPLGCIVCLMYEKGKKNMPNRPQVTVSMDELLKTALEYFKDAKRFDESEDDYSHMVESSRIRAETVVYLAEVADHGTRYGYGEGQVIDSEGTIVYGDEYPELVARFLWMYEKYVGDIDDIDSDLIAYFKMYKKGTKKRKKS